MTLVINFALILLIFFFQIETNSFFILGSSLVIPAGICTLYLYKKYDSTFLFRLYIFFITFVLLNYRAYELQSHSSALLPWFIAFFVISVQTVDYKSSFLILVSNLLVMSYGYFYGTVFEGFLALKYQIIVNQIYPTLLIVIFLLYKKLIERLKEKEVELFQKKDVISKMIITLSREINSPLTVAKLTVNKLRRECDDESVDRIEESLNRITKVTHLIEDINELKEVEYGEGKMYDLYNSVRNKGRSKKDILS
ncbi:hypothetical protein DAY19_07590 [Halobacteriovorax vibrionivorans]|uniref:histidine kinase n=1 Tax=Halobacteriovorax vibrionivorans TaxID=2152716 RepID=A0ABY0IF16_9BACT|nr:MULTISPECIES: hypothetical protein [Halobacteriovorax]RZF21542.1 hypothetical protein DAY19_07590 [Halobacteriovorax vibrionivorans]TGD49165.1 hypothetical protein EP118_01460 [Halobacteriovorax sp. Y22]